MEPAEASTGVDEDDEHLPNTLKDRLASIEAEVEHAANLEPSKPGCLAAVCEKLQNAAVEGVPARGDVHQQFRRDLKDESLTAKYEQQCQNRTCIAKSGPQIVSKCRQHFQSVTDFSKGTYRLLARIAVEEGKQQETAARFAASVRSWALHVSCDTFSMQFKFVHFEEGSDETLPKAWATKQELGEESEPKAPELVTEEKR